MTTDLSSDLVLLDNAITELRTLWPALADALERDQTTGDGRGGKSSPFRVPVNQDVLDTIRELAVDIPTIDREARAALGDPPRVHTVEQVLYMLPSVVTRLAGNPELRLRFNSLKLAIERWQRLARRAIGLSQHPTGIGHDCPHHRDRARTELLHRGAEAELITNPGTGEEAIRWGRRELIFCPDLDCGNEWPVAYWPYLGRLLQQADATPTAQEEPA